MKMSKRILSSILAILMVVSVCSVGFTATAADASSGASAKLEEVKLELIDRPVVNFTCTEITRVAKAVDSVEPGDVIVKSTPSGVPELSGSYVAEAYAGETPVQTTITFTTPTVGVSVRGISCNNENVVLSDITLDGSTGTYTVKIESGTVAKNEDGTYNPLVFTVDYEWTDGNSYQEKCVSYVEGITTGGSYVEAHSEIQSLSGTSSYYRVYASAATRLLGKGVYYELPANTETSTDDPYKSYGVYNVATGTALENVAAGYNTSFYSDDKTDKPSGTMNQANEFTVSGTTLAHVYVDSSVATTLADQNIRLDSTVGALSDRNNDNPYTALQDAWVSTGSNVDSIVTENDASAQAAIGLDIPAKADYGVTQYEKNASMTTVTPGVGQYQKLFTQPLTGTVANLVDGSSYTVTLDYYAYMYVNDGLLKKFNMTSSPIVPVSMTFHIVDKSELREMIDYVLNSDPTEPKVRVSEKGTNPQSWYYSSGFSAFQTNYVNALNVLNNPQSSQIAIDAATSSLSSSYKNLTLKGADYTEVNALKKEAQAIKKEAAYYTDDSIALIDEALDCVTTGYSILYQGAVDTMATNLQIAIDNAELKDADYSVINANSDAFAELNEEDYVPATWAAVEEAFEQVDYTLSAKEQDTVDAWADEIIDAMNGLILLSDVADWSGVIDAINESKTYDLSIYVNGDDVTVAVKAAENAMATSTEENPWTVDRQDEIDALENSIREAIKNLKLDVADKDALIAAVGAELPENTACLNKDLLLDYKALLAEAQIVINNEKLSIKDQPTVDDMRNRVTTAYTLLMASLSHTAGDSVKENEVPATCTTAGSYDSVVYCTVCGEELSREATTVPAFGHTEGEEEIINEVEADCENDGGYDTVVYCTVCDEEISKVHTTIEALGHKPGEAKIENEIAATRDESGSYDSVYYCTVCGDEISRTTVTIPALGHESAAPVRENEVAATCTTDGSYDLVVYCSCCEDKVQLSRNTVTVAAAGHNEGEWTTVTEATCTAKGSEELKCTVCSEVLDTKETDALGHTDGEAVKENEVAATCTTDGSYDTVVYCTVCDEELSRVSSTVVATGHTEGEWVVTKEPAVGVAGEETLYCSVCGEAYETKEISAITAYLIAKEGTTTVIDKERGFIYGLEEGISDLEDFVTYEGGVLEYVETKNGFGTGTVVNFVVNGEVYETYTIVIFGDVTGDAVVDTFDATRLAQIVNGDIELTDGTAEAYAADIANDDEVADTFDLTRMYRAVNGDIVIEQVK